jgi:cytochrome c peroxidase
MRKLLLLPFFLWACSSPEQVVPDEKASSVQPEVIFKRPGNFQDPIYALANNPVTVDGFELGKALFNEPMLSRDNSIACAECHNQSYAFTHHGHDVSHGVDNRVGTRNAQPIQNMAWQKEFFWDGGVGDLDLFSVAPIENPLEMDERLGNVLTKLRASTKYPALFKKAYGSTEITSQKFLKALSQFMVSLVSANSRYDKFIRKEGVILTVEEQEGLNLFKQKCSSCHAGELFSDQSYRNNGLNIQGSKDEGRFRITENPSDRYMFKVPSLRNVEMTAPYMHDGRFYTLEEVLRHYTTGVQQSQNLDPILKNGITLSEDEQAKIVAFLKTLTDREFLTNPKFAGN